MIVEYVDLLFSSDIDSFRCYDKLHASMTDIVVCLTNKVYDLYFCIVNRSSLDHRKSYDKIYISCSYENNHDAFMSVFYFY